MATIIDELVVKLGMDNKGLKKGSEDSKKAIEGLGKNTKEASKTVDGLGYAFTKMFAVVGGLNALKSFTQHIIESNAELSRLAKNTGEVTEKISTLQNAAKVAGGSAQEIASQMQSMKQAFFQGQYTEMDSPLFKTLALLRVSATDTNRKLKEMDQLWSDINESAQSMPKDLRYQFLVGNQFNASSAELLSKDRAEYLDLVDKQKKNAITTAEAEKAEAARQAIEKGKLDLEKIGNMAISALLPDTEKPTPQALAQYIYENSKKSKRGQMPMHVAQGMVGNFLGENSSLEPGVVNSTGHAGIPQLSRSRQKAVEKHFGKPFVKMSWKEQMNAVQWELDNPESKAGDALYASKTAEEAAEIATRQYERPEKEKIDFFVKDRQKRIPKMPNLQGYQNAPISSSTTNQSTSNVNNVGTIIINAPSGDARDISNTLRNELNGLPNQADRSLR